MLKVPASDFEATKLTVSGYRYAACRQPSSRYVKFLLFHCPARAPASTSLCIQYELSYLHSYQLPCHVTMLRVTLDTGAPGNVLCSVRLRIPTVPRCPNLTLGRTSFSTQDTLVPTRLTTDTLDDTSRQVTHKGHDSFLIKRDSQITYSLTLLLHKHLGFISKCSLQHRCHIIRQLATKCGQVCCQ
jgi:hypothetical protein